MQHNPQTHKWRVLCVSGQFSVSAVFLFVFTGYFVCLCVLVVTLWSFLFVSCGFVFILVILCVFAVVLCVYVVIFVSLR